MIVTSPAPVPQKCQKTLLDLPPELLDGIFGYFSWEEVIGSPTLICKKVKSVVENDHLWQKHLDRFIQLPYKPSNLPQLKNVPVKRIFFAIIRARFYTWGESTLGKLGHSYPVIGSALRGHRVPRGVNTPLEIRTLRDVFIVDIKTGGWSTHFLTSDGEVYSFGSISGQGLLASQEPAKMITPDPVVQISSGRSHLLALTSEDEIYTRVDLNATPLRIQFYEQEIVRSDPRSKSTKAGRVTKVVGGWNCSGALVHGRGIVIWRHDIRVDEMQLRAKGVIPTQGDSWVQESVIEPPSFETLNDKPLDPLSRRLDKECDRQIMDFVILEGYLVFITVGGRVYCVEMRNALPVLPPIFLPKFSTPEPEGREIVDQGEIDDKRVDRISGLFKQFAIYNRRGLIHIGDSKVLKNAVEQTRRVRVSGTDREEIQPLAMPNLQAFGAIAQIVFGDYHTHALTHDGKLLSWGVESQNCGCLGIGNSEESGRRGVVWDPRGNGSLNEAAEVFFYKPPYPKSCYPQKAADGSPNWDFSVPENQGDAEVRLDHEEFCVLKISAAGWHSGALVLPVTDYLLRGVKESARGVMPAIHNEHSFDPDALELPFTGHRGIRGISSIARGMRGGLRGRGGLSSSGVVRSGADQEMKQRHLDEDTAEAGERLGESIREAVRGMPYRRGGTPPMG